MIRTVAVVGTGLIGTSVALAVRRRDVTVFLEDRDEGNARAAATRGAGMLTAPEGPVDLAVLAVPPSQVAPVLAAVQRRGLAEVYTDVAGAKGVPERAVLDRAPDPSRYVGGHPMAGRERSGPAAAFAELFEGRPWVLTPSSATARTAVLRATELVQLCGATPIEMSSRAHDDAVALTSHVPHLVATLMAARLLDGPPEASRLVGQGLRDVTRIAAGDAGLWADILSINAPAIVPILRAVQADLASLVTALSPGPTDNVDQCVDVLSVHEVLQRGVAGVKPLING